MKAQTIALAGVALVAVVVLASVMSWRVARAIGPDVDNDGVVSFLDLLAVIRAFG